jgi:hypothetical protein
MQEQPERQAIRQFVHFMRLGDTESAYQAVETVKFNDFVDALEGVQREVKPVTDRPQTGNTVSSKSKGHGLRHKEIRPGSEGSCT